MLILWCACEVAGKVEVKTQDKNVWIDIRQRGTYHPDEVWEVLTDYEELPQFIPHLDSSRVLDRTDSTIVVYQEGSNRLLLPWTFRLNLEFIEVGDKSPKTLFFSLLEGNVKQYKGFFEIVEQDDGVEIHYQAFTQHRIPLPNWLLRFILRRQLGGMMPAITSEIERRRISGPLAE